jgi:hypothetical protein
MNASVNMDSQQASAVDAVDEPFIMPPKLDMLKALAVEIDNAFALCDNYKCLITTNIDPETDADNHAMQMLGLAVDHMVELWASSREELAVKAGVFYRHIGLTCPIDGVEYYADYWQNLMFSIAQDASRLFGRPAAA